MKQTIELHKRWKADPSKGEVFTPSELVREMLDKIPTSVWENPESLFLDPCMGTGTFLIEILKRLINIYGYSKEDAVSRVYGYDTLVKYVNRAKRRGLVNVFHKDFLNEEIIMKFDVVIGNPPYQSSTSETNSANALWVKFGDKVKDLVKEDGYMAFIHPDSWVNYRETYDNSNKGRMTTKLYRARVFDVIKPFFVWIGNSIRTQYFSHVGVDFSIVIGKKTTEKMPITLKHDSNVIIIDNLGKKLIPKTAKQEIIGIFDKLFNNNENFFKLLQNNNSNFVSDTRKWIHISKEQSQQNIYPLCNTSSQYNKGQYLWSSIPHEFQNVSKVIFSDSGYSRPFYDEGIYGLSSHSFGIKSDFEQSEKVIFYLNSKTLNKILKYMGNSGAESQLSVIKNMIPLINLEKINLGDETSIVNNITLLYGLTLKEKEFLLND
jgi:methylase of polypeptide subunit release factors